MARTYAPNRIREVRKARGMSQEELGAAMAADLTGSTVAKLEKGRMALSLDYLTEIAGILQVDVLDLLPGDGPLVRTIPVIGMVAAGAWQEAIQVSGESIPIPPHVEGRNLFALRPTGDSMDKLVPAGNEGGYVVVNPDDRELKHGRYYVVQNGDGETTFKQFSADPLALLPCSTNPTHKPIPLGTETFTVIGRVIYVAQAL